MADVNEFPFPVISDKPGRPNKLAYAAKAYYAWKLLNQGYSRVLMLDDTCLVGRYSRNVFNVVPIGFTAFTETGLEHALDSFNFIDSTVKKSSLASLKRYNSERYGNTGVVLYDRNIMDAISPERIIKASSLVVAKRPHQTLFYYLLERAGSKIKIIPDTFNKVPGTKAGLTKEQRKELNSIESYFDPTVDIWHVTGFYEHRQELIYDIAKKLL